MAGRPRIVELAQDQVARLAPGGGTKRQAAGNAAVCPGHGELARIRILNSFTRAFLLAT